MRKHAIHALLALATTLTAVFTAPTASAAPVAPQRCATALGSNVVHCAATIEQARADAGVSARLLGARLFDLKHRDFSGAYLEVYVEDGCTPSYDDEGPSHRIADLGVYAFNNRISSLSTFNQCDVKLFGLINFGGASSTWIDVYDDLSNLGDGWNNRAGSVKLS